MEDLHFSDFDEYLFRGKASAQVVYPVDVTA
jgi:hypothetical protein